MTKPTDQQMAKFYELTKENMHEAIQPFIVWVSERFERFTIPGADAISLPDGNQGPLINTPLAIRTFIEECHGEEWASEAIAAAISLLSAVHADDNRFNFKF